MMRSELRNPLLQKMLEIKLIVQKDNTNHRRASRQQALVTLPCPRNQGIITPSPVMIQRKPPQESPSKALQFQSGTQPIIPHIRPLLMPILPPIMTESGMHILHDGRRNWTSRCLFVANLPWIVTRVTVVPFPATIKNYIDRGISVLLKQESVESSAAVILFSPLRTCFYPSENKAKPGIEAIFTYLWRML